MESHRARRLTTLGVVVALAAGLLALVAGSALALRAPLVEDARAVPLGALPRALAEGDASAWLSLGALIILALPTVRVVGILTTLHAEGERRSLLAGGALLVILLGGLARLAF